MTEVASIQRLDELSVGSELPELHKDPITKVQLVKYAGASGDYNLIHTDDETAKRVGLDGVIAHGMLSMAFLGQYCCWLGGPESIRRLTVRFAEMVRPGDVLICRGRVKSREEGGAELPGCALPEHCCKRRVAGPDGAPAD